MERGMVLYSVVVGVLRKLASRLSFGFEKEDIWYKKRDNRVSIAITRIVINIFFCHAVDDF